MSNADDNRTEDTINGDLLAKELKRRNLKIVKFREICCCGDEIWIENEGEIYRLRRTRQGKLILTK